MKTVTIALFSVIWSSWALAGSEQQQDWGVYSKLELRISNAQQIAKIKAVEAAVKKAEVPPQSDEAALIRMGMGVAPDDSRKANDCCFDIQGKVLGDREVAERLAVEEAMRRGGIESGSEQEAQMRAAAAGRAQTAEGEAVDQQTLEDMAKEVAKQQAAAYSGAQQGSAAEAMIDTGVEVFWGKMKGWFE